MIGNDIVDLAKAREESNVFRPRYLEKICKDTEISIVKSSLYPVETFWRIWTMKESAYKAWQRNLKTIPAFNPLAFKCELKNSKEGVVYHKSSLLSTKTTQTADFIYSEVISTKGNRCFFGSNEEFLDLIKLQYTLNSVPELNKTNLGLPFLIINNKLLEVSKTHHGKYQVFQY
ncbi:4'-phosphopantetheinyl transferase family protein [Psychroflexus tropicus]|uniref:4'-phosphopantetheinyl transferase family protein n=1 Tax=Psychroflexus tropicus TaxID=197345 RepID=UPI00036C69BD|nr:4'-phosphopantetheinyl transferase superfamily protein [Psychroflexus tropicus]